ncbi:hypothetical protein E2R60_06975 [Paenibacillus dendritiformis]|uniref:hypothetical protein n=1 Tax=Paenibacillus dendritiformis TaxID=130049 RepID=UPI001059AF01|nr:hypothetical protein [Paenibacillus dendritiformis]TDL58191.1 hypothetical protein E2R60_06975 [Paenibacillus dendritiformis]
MVQFVRSTCLVPSVVPSAPPSFHGSTSRKTAKMQVSLITFIPLEQFLQSNINLSHANGVKAKIGENDALLQESHQIATQLAKIAAFTQDYAASSVFRGITRRRLPHFPPSSLSRLVSRHDLMK